MSPSEAQQFLKENEVKYILAQFVDIHGSAKTKSVPAEHYNTVVTDGAGFAGFAIWGMGMTPNVDADYMAVGDASTLSLVPGSRAMPASPVTVTPTASRTNTTPASC